MKGLYGALLTAGLILALGIAGGSDAELLSTAFIDKGLIISAVMMLAGGYGLWLEDAREKNSRRIRYVPSESEEDGGEDEEQLQAG